MGQVIMGWLNEWFAQNATVRTLLFLMTCDVITGIMLAIINRKLNSSASTKGMIRKSIALMFVGIGRVLGNGPVSEAIAIGFCLSELMSIAENAGLLGVPLPPPLKRIMSVLAEQAKDNSGRPDLVESAFQALEHKDGSQ